MGKYVVKVNDIESFQELVQSIYDESLAIINLAQQQINKLENSTDLKDELMDGKQKYASAIHNFIQDRDKAIGRRVDIAKLLADLIKTKGNVLKTLENPTYTQEVKKLTLEELKRQLVEKERNGGSNASQLY